MKIARSWCVLKPNNDATIYSDGRITAVGMYVYGRATLGGVATIPATLYASVGCPAMGSLRASAGIRVNIPLVSPRYPNSVSYIGSLPSAIRWCEGETLEPLLFVETGRLQRASAVNYIKGRSVLLSVAGLNRYADNTTD